MKDLICLKSFIIYFCNLCFFFSFLFWSNHGESTFIESADLSGNNRKIIVKNNLLWVPDIKCDPDPTKKLLYWADNNRNTLETSDYQGMNRKVIYRSPNINLFITNIDIYKVRNLWQCSWPSTPLHPYPPHPTVHLYIPLHCSKNLMDIAKFWIQVLKLK